MKIPYFTANNLPTTHGFFTRKGGVSTGVYTSLNLGANQEDDVANVRENERRVLMQWPGQFTDLVLLHQVHSDTVIEATEVSVKKMPGDALITSVPGLLIGVKSADCIPILISNTQGTWVGAVHAGWRGVLQNIVTKTLIMLKEKHPIGEWHAAIGPCLHQEIFEVGQEVYDDFIRAFPESKVCFLDHGKKFLFDSKRVVMSQLEKAGVANIVDLNINTYTHPEDFFSYRRSTHEGEKRYGGQVSVIGVPLT